ncbi:MAG TPA: 7-cyano-7-deazaguanine synthase QueC, partial [Enhygromyxa sp.]|nr:7-cyano-7-deazaguanine synthase QueC [Enhygromyxa sp.]
QRHRHELAAARRVAASLGVARHLELDLDLSAMGGSSLTSAADVPKDRPLDADDIPSTYVPARNTIFLSIALGWAEVLGAADIHIGVNALDYSGYPDCRPAFIDAFERTANLATKLGVEAAPGEGIRIHAPLIDLYKHEIIARGVALGVDYADTASCYDPRERDGSVLACGRCESCALRRAGFARAGVDDPTRYLQKG